jgi:DNA helicase-2/ATP-dependent DNA helicase PcrA
MTADAFARALSELSEIQREAADWGDGPLLVLAGPGSGKTRVLTARIARLLETTRGSNFRVLALTFTNKAADEMRTRVINLVPGQDQRLFLGTFHSFCADVLRQQGMHVGVRPNFHIYSQESDLQAVLQDAVEEAKKTADAVMDLDKKLLGVIQRLKSFLVKPDDSPGRFKDTRLGERVALVYRAYEEQLAKRNALDCDSLLLKTWELLTKFPALSRRYQTVYRYLCLDEFQDTNPAQYILIRALTTEHRNLFVVADDDQIIYQWNGASHKRIEELRRDYAPRVVQLPMNYRCPPEIVALANNLIRHNFLRTSDKKPLEAIRPSQGADVVRLLPPFRDVSEEVAAVAGDIRARHSQELGTVVVLARSRRLLDIARDALEREGLRAVISQRKDEFESIPFVWLHSILRLADERQDKASLEAVCGTMAQLTGVDVDPEDVVTQAGAGNRDLLQFWLRLARGGELQPLAREGLELAPRHLAERVDLREFAKLAVDWLDKVVQAQKQALGQPTADVFVRYDEERAVWEELWREIRQALGLELTLGAFLQELDLRSKEAPPRPDAVTLMTIHGAKGKEFHHVYLIGLVDDELPSFRSKQKGDDSPEMEEERRSCFVAITRTITALTLSYALRYRGWPKTPSRFLSEMGLLRAGNVLDS